MQGASGRPSARDDQFDAAALEFLGIAVGDAVVGDPDAVRRIVALALHPPQRGEHLPREAENWDPKEVFIRQRYRTKEQWLDKHGHPFTPNTHYWVGGNTTFYGAALMRMRERDFTGSASHELRTPITVISGAVELLEQSDLSEEDVKAVDRIRRATLAHQETLREEFSPLIGDDDVAVLLDFARRLARHEGVSPAPPPGALPDEAL